MKMKKVYIFRNEFHGTEVSLRLEVAAVERKASMTDIRNYLLTDGQKVKAEKALCPSSANGCRCGGLGDFCIIVGEQ
jgi:hypothetical protein